MNRNLKLVVNNTNKDEDKKLFFERTELKIILDLYAKMVSSGNWKDYGPVSYTHLTLPTTPYV